MSAPAVAAPLLERTDPWSRNFPAYAQIVRARFKTALTYRQNIFLFLTVAVLQIFMLRKVWTALYHGQKVVNGLPIHAMIVYLSIAALQLWAMQDPGVIFYLHSRIRQGKIAFDLIRPPAFLPQIFAHLTGSAVSGLMFVVLTLPVVAFAGALSGPASVTAALLYVPSLLAGYVISMLMTLMLGMLAFWTLQIDGLTMLYILFGQFFAGALVPIPFFPPALRLLAEVLPFQSTTYLPVAIYVGRVHGNAAMHALALQLLWVVILAIAANVMWRRSLHRVVVQGG